MPTDLVLRVLPSALTPAERDAKTLRTKLRRVTRRRRELRRQSAELRAQILDLELEPHAPARIAAWNRVHELAS